MLKTGIIPILAIAAIISILLGAAVSLHLFQQEQPAVPGPEQTQSPEPGKAEPSVSAGCDQVVWQGTEVELHATTKNIKDPVFVWRSGEEILGTRKDLSHIFAVGEHTITLEVSFRDNRSAENRTMKDSLRIIVLDRVSGISVNVSAGRAPAERNFQTTYRGASMLIPGITITVDGIPYNKITGCGRISVAGLSPGQHRWYATYHGETVANGTFIVAEITQLKIKEVGIASLYHIGDTVDAKLVVLNTGTTPVSTFTVKVLIVNHKYEWMGDIAKYEYSTEYTNEIQPGQQMDLPVRARIPEKVGVIKPTGDYSITISLLINGQEVDRKTVTTTII